MRLPTLRAQNQTFCILELDHPLLFAEQLGVSVADPAGLAHIQQVQGELMRALSPEVSGVVLDSESSYWALEQKAQHTGVVFSLEKQTSESDPLAVPRLAETWGVVPTKNNYALSKLKLAYHPSQKAALQKRQFVAEISEYSHQQGIDFILEIDLMHEGEALLLRPAKDKESSRELDERAPIDPEPGSLSGKRRSRKDVQPLARAAKVRSTGAKLALVPTTAKGDDKGRKSRRRY